MVSEPNNPEFRSAVERIIAPALSRIGFSEEVSTFDPVWDGYFFKRGDERVCVYYLQKDIEFNFMVSPAGGEQFKHPFDASSSWLYGTKAIERVRGRELTDNELEEIGSYLFRKDEDIARLFTNQLIEVLDRQGQMQ